MTDSRTIKFLRHVVDVVMQNDKDFVDVSCYKLVGSVEETVELFVFDSFAHLISLSFANENYVSNPHSHCCLQ